MTLRRELERRSFRGFSKRARANRGPGRTSWPCLSLCALALVVLGPWFALAQAQTDGVDAAGYSVHQSIELGYRFSDQSGSTDMYNTLVNLQQGPRILEQTFSMRSPTHTGLLFDNLYVNSFGWGGDPNNVLRFRADKGKWYNLQGSFRRDQNFFNYDLLANPLNPPTSTPNIPVVDSPHLFATVRRMSDVDLTLLPQSRISFRLGYSRNNMTGPSESSFHNGTDASLLQLWNTTTNDYRFGVDFKLQPRTVLSYDQTFTYFKGDTDYRLNPFAEVPLPGGGSVSLGLPINTAAGQPCSVPTGQTSLIDPITGALTNTTCNAYFSYLRTQRVRTSTPTERLSLRSSPSERLDITASYAYSSSDLNTPLNESFNGLVTRTNTRAYKINGQAHARQITNNGQASATLRLREHLRLIYTFYLWNYRMPESFLASETDFICTPPCTLLTPLPAPGAPVVSSTLTSFNQTLVRNQMQVAWDISKKMGVNIGFRYSRQNLVHVLDFLTGDVDNVLVNGFTPLFGFWAKPTSHIRFNFDYEHTNNDNDFVRIGPRKQAIYRFQAGYTPRPWAVLGASVNLQESSNGDQLTDYRSHNRNYGFNVSLSPKERFGIDLAYNFNDVQQNALICFNDVPPTGVTLPVVTNAGSCIPIPPQTFNPYNDPGNPLLTNGSYTNNTNFGTATVMVKPLKRVTTRLGYSITTVSGSTPQFNILQPLGSLAYHYQQPLANLSVDLGHGVTGNAGWNYYQYNEQSFVGPTASRYFHANNATVSMVYAF